MARLKDKVASCKVCKTIEDYTNLQDGLCLECWNDDAFYAMWPAEPWPISAFGTGEVVRDDLEFADS